MHNQSTTVWKGFLMNWRVSFCLLPTALAPLNAQKYHMQQKVVVRVRCRLFCCTLHHVPDLRKSFGIFFFFETTKIFTFQIKPVLLQSRTQLDRPRGCSKEKENLYWTLLQLLYLNVSWNVHLCDLKLLIKFNNIQYDPMANIVEFEVPTTQAYAF